MDDIKDIILLCFKSIEIIWPVLKKIAEFISKAYKARKQRKQIRKIVYNSIIYVHVLQEGIYNIEVVNIHDDTAGIYDIYIENRPINQISDSPLFFPK